MNKWRMARKKSEHVKFREPKPTVTFHNVNRAIPVAKKTDCGEYVNTEHGMTVAVCGRDFIVKDKLGLRVVTKEKFWETYDFVAQWRA